MAYDLIKIILALLSYMKMLIEVLLFSIELKTCAQLNTANFVADHKEENGFETIYNVDERSNMDSFTN